MSGVTQELEQTLQNLDPQSATQLERRVRDVLTLFRQNKAKSSAHDVDERGWPVGYFEKTAGSFAGEPLDLPDDPPPAPSPEW